MSPVGGETVQHTHVPGIKRRAVGTKGARESIAPLDLGRNRCKTCSIEKDNSILTCPFQIFRFSAGPETADETSSRIFQQYTKVSLINDNFIPLVP